MSIQNIRRTNGLIEAILSDGCFNVLGTDEPSRAPRAQSAHHVRQDGSVPSDDDDRESKHQDGRNRMVGLAMDRNQRQANDTCDRKQC